MTIARKLYLLIVAVVLGVIMQAVVGLYQSHRIASSAGYSATNTIPSVLALNGATDAIYGIRLNIARYVIEPTAREKTVANMAALHQKAQDFFDQFERCCISDDTDRRMLEADRLFLPSTRSTAWPWSTSAVPARKMRCALPWKRRWRLPASASWPCSMNTRTTTSSSAGRAPKPLPSICSCPSI
ncbi:hypothetical protein Hsc_2872 [Herbaspirillum seropedicae]|nr:hypothetical protein Hsc_2872 [Herbaspirillum seropedicae]